jgi:tRNA U34 5-carboxymethylaminomethyl modifying enzyme MnmG/GidA
MEVVSVFPELKKIKGEIAEQLEIEGRYQGYLSRQAQDIADFKKDEALKIPDNLDYHKVGKHHNRHQTDTQGHKIHEQCTHHSSFDEYNPH